jgi:hypothetical protein
MANMVGFIDRNLRLADSTAQPTCAVRGRRIAALAAAAGPRGEVAACRDGPGLPRWRDRPRSPWLLQVGERSPSAASCSSSSEIAFTVGAQIALSAGESPHDLGLTMKGVALDAAKVNVAFGLK